MLSKVAAIADVALNSALPADRERRDLVQPRAGRCAVVDTRLDKSLIVMKPAFNNLYLIIHNPINQSMFFSNSSGPKSLVLIF